MVYALSEAALSALAGPGHNHLNLPCREVFARAARPVEVCGPALEEEARAVHLDFWS